MNISQLFNTSLILLLLCNFTKSDELNELVRYKLYWRDNMTMTETVIYESVVRSGENVLWIRIFNMLPVLKKGLLQIFHETESLTISNTSLTEIEPGSFDRQKITDCIYLTKNELTVVRTGTMRNLQINYLSLTNNKIEYIEKNAITNMPNLEGIDLSSNKLKRIDVLSFVNTPKMNYLNLEDNNLTKIGKQNFDFMNNAVEMITAKNNKIREIHSQALESKIVSIAVLENNKIKNIPEEIWINGNVKNLYLQNNDLDMLPESFFTQTTLSFVNLLNNPLRCEILEKLNETMKITNISIMYDERQVC
jgi:Leucine-rich repeat (LRR) protein